MADEARSLSYSIKIEADTAQAEANIRSLTSGLGNLDSNGNKSVKIGADTIDAKSGIYDVTSGLDSIEIKAKSLGSAFRSSFLGAIDSGETFSTSIKTGFGGAIVYANNKAKELSSNVNSMAQSFGSVFEHPAQAIKTVFGGAIQSAQNKLVALARSAEKTAAAADDVGNESQKAVKGIENLGNSADESGSKMEKFGSVLKSVGTATVAVSAAAAASAIALGVQVVSSYADFEQLVGGVDTLFGTASQTVQNYAANAFQTSGMSANAYMELVTSFSASMISSLGGDTARAAKASDQAITDMADNANKMGTSLDSIQNAYRGFSMQNYTMLDNLKLGYGGTEDEMKRLLADAEALSGVEYDISSFSDVTEAIHVIQTEMGITGTTAKEAAETISGSIASTKSAFQNLITGLGNPDSDIKVLVGNVASNFKNVVANITPVVENLAAALPNAIGQLAPAVGELLPPILTAATGVFTQVLSSLVSMLPQLIPVAIDAVTLIATTLVDNAPTLINAVLTTTSNLAGAAGKLLPMFADVAMQIVTSLASGLGEQIPKLAPVLVEGIITVANTLIENIPQLIVAGMQLASGLAEGLFKALPVLIMSVPSIIATIVGALIEGLPMILEEGGRIILSLATGILDSLPALITQMPAIITGICEFVIANFPAIIETGMELLTQLGVGLIQAIPQLVATVPSIIAAIVGAFSSAASAMWDIGKSIVEGIWQGISNASSWLKEKVTGFANGIVEDAKNVLGIHSPSTVFAGIGGNMALGLGEGFSSAMRGVEKTLRKSIPTSFDAPIPGSVAGTTYTVSPIVETADTLSVGDVTYGVNPEVKSFNPPATSASAVYGQESFAAITADSVDKPESSYATAAFAPSINITVQGGANEESIENLRESMYDVVRQLFHEFREEELERMSLKNQYAF